MLKITTHVARFADDLIVTDIKSVTDRTCDYCEFEVADAYKVTYKDGHVETVCDDHFLDI